MFIRLYVFLCGKEIFERGPTKASNKARGITGRARYYYAYIVLDLCYLKSRRRRRSACVQKLFI